VIHQWEYQKVDLHDVPRKHDEIDILNDAGKDGWELVAITTNNMAILKRQVPEPAAAPKSPRRKSVTPTNP
jgi:Domain of unknown function (DUF4177)